jgi:hypothetical protein
MFKCQFCNTVLPYLKAIDHLNSCNDKPPICNCGQFIKEEDMAEHQKSCKLMKIQCLKCDLILEENDFIATHDCKKALKKKYKET